MNTTEKYKKLKEKAKQAMSNSNISNYIQLLIKAEELSLVKVKS